MERPTSSEGREPSPETVRAAEAALARLGYHRLPSAPAPGGAFWVQEADLPKRAHPVFLWNGPFDEPVTGLTAWRQAAAASAGPAPRPIVVVPNERAAEAALGRAPKRSGSAGEMAVLVVPTTPTPAQKPHWHALVLSRREVLDVATGVVVGLFRRAQRSEGSTEIDFQEMLAILRKGFRIDLQASLGVDSDEGVLFLLYQLARRYGFAPGDNAANLHLLVLRPTGPAARWPWFAA